MQFIHVSDLHFHSSQKDNKEANDLFKYIKANYPKHNVIVTGDITDDGMETQYENAYKAMAPFKNQIFICPGNHDFGAVGMFYTSEKAKRFDDMMARPLGQSGTFYAHNQPVVHVLKKGDTEVMLIALDTNLETELPFDFSCGEVGKTQLNAIKSLLSSPAAQGKVKILFMHHHPFMRNDPFMELKDARELMSSIYLRIDVLLFGHRHKWESWTNKGGIRHILASDNSPGKSFAREVTVKKSDIAINDIPIQKARESHSSKNQSKRTESEVMA
jgi:3',5'-cyclic AMP phosphodiesterase CpdA